MSRLVTWLNDRLLLNYKDETVADGLMTATGDVTTEDCCCGANDGCYFIDDFKTASATRPLALWDSIDGTIATQFSPRIICSGSTSVATMIQSPWQVTQGDVVGSGNDSVTGNLNINKAYFDTGDEFGNFEVAWGIPNHIGHYFWMFIPGYSIKATVVDTSFNRPIVRVKVFDDAVGDTDLAAPANNFTPGLPGSDEILWYDTGMLGPLGAGPWETIFTFRVTPTQIQMRTNSVASPPTLGVIQCDIPIGKTETRWGIGGDLNMNCAFLEWYCCDGQADCAAAGTVHPCDLEDAGLCTP